MSLIFITTYSIYSIFVELFAKLAESSWLYLDGECGFGSICLQVNLHGSGFTSFCDHFVTQLFQSITAIRDQLPDENLMSRQSCGLQSEQLI